VAIGENQCLWTLESRFLITVGATFGYAAGWNPYATDYTRYLAPDTSKIATGVWAGLGIFVSCTFLEIVGAASATIATSGDLNPTASFTSHLPGWSSPSSSSSRRTATRKKRQSSNAFWYAHSRPPWHTAGGLSASPGRSRPPARTPGNVPQPAGRLVGVLDADLRRPRASRMDSVRTEVDLFLVAVPVDGAAGGLGGGNHLTRPQHQLPGTL
jgi:hypothetical protein